MISPTTELAIITGALKLLSPGPERWTQGAFAKTASGLVIGPLEDRATCFCLSGAIRRACQDDVATWRSVFNGFEVVVGRSITAWNDHSKRKYTDVITLLQTRADQLRGEIERDGGAG